MKRVLVTTVIALVTLAVAAPAPAAGPTVKSLARQIKTLQKQVKTLRTQVSQARATAATALVYSGCTTAVTVDAFQGTWTLLDQKHATGFGPQTALNDFQTCQLLRITRAPAQVPPNTAVFSSLLALFNS